LQSPTQVLLQFVRQLLIFMEGATSSDEDENLAQRG